jgi:hypothetical protein
LYFSLLLLRKSVQNREDITSIVRELAIQNSNKKTIKGREVFLVRVYNEEKLVLNVLQEILDN